MDNLLMLFDEESQNRYKTVLENIKNASDSFYDSYNSLLEQFLRSITINHVRGSVTSIIKDKMNKDFLLNDVKLNPKTFHKIQDLALKLNSHKHKTQKKINIDFVISYMRVFYDLVFDYAKYKKYTIPSFNEDYFINLYNCFEKDKQDIQEIKDEVAHISKSLRRRQEQEENLKFRAQVFHCGKYGYESFLSDREFKIRKIVISILFLVCMTFLLIGGFTGDENSKTFLYFSIPFMIYYGFRLIQFILCKKQIRCDSTGHNNFLYTNLTDDFFPLAIDSVKIYHYVINFIYCFFIFGFLNNVFYILLLVTFIVTWIFFNKMKKTYLITVMFTEFGEYYYSPLSKNIIKKRIDGSL